MFARLPPVEHSAVEVTSTSGSGSTSSVPNIDVEFDPDDRIDLTPCGYFYELWRTDTTS